MIDPAAPSAIGLAVVLLATGVVAARAASAPEPARPRAASATERVEVSRSVEASEPTWRRESDEHFPEDHWSARDDFHGREATRIRELANERGISYEDVLRAIDDDLHGRATRDPKRGDPRSAGAVPCKPRPFYD